MATRTDIIIDQGATYSFSFSPQSNTDLTGYTGKSLLKKDFESNTSVAFSVSTNTTSGAVTIGLTAAQTVDLVPGRYVYDVELISSSNTVIRWAEGTAIVTPGVSL